MAERGKTSGNDEPTKDEPNPEFQNFQRLLEDALSVPKEELAKRRAKYEREKANKRTGR